MLQSERVTFVESLCNNVRDELIGKIKRGDIPDNWTGLELRELLADRFDQMRSVMHSQYLKRRKAYRNEVLVRNL